MKKNGLGSRILAALLALTMIVSMIPLSVFAASGAISNGSTGLTGDIDTKDTISWPIKVYDYLNDGMLFEYATAQDTTVTAQNGGAYGGGEIMPGRIYNGGDLLGADFTINDPNNNTDSVNDIYDQTYFNYWLSNMSDYQAGNAPQGTNTPGAFKFLRLSPYNGNADVPAMVITDFANDTSYYSGKSSSHAKSRVRYAVVVYRTETANMKLSMGVSDSKGGQTLMSYTGSVATDKSGNKVLFDLGQEVTLQGNGKWNYAVLDLSLGNAASGWNNGSTVKQIVLDTNMSSTSQYLDLSHIVYFSDKAEALRFGERAAAFSTTPGEFLPDQTYTESGYTMEVATVKPSYNYGQDYTDAAAFDKNSYKVMSSSYGMTTKKGTYTNKNGEKMSYMNVSNNTAGRDYSYVATFSSDGYTLPGINSVDWCVMVYRTNNLTNTTSKSDRIAFWVNATDSDYGHGAYGGSSYWSNYWADQPFTISNGKWTYAVFNLAETNIYDYNDGYDYNDIYENFSNIGSIKNIGIYFPGFDSGESMDISHLCFFSNKTDASSFGQQALAYLEGDATYTKTVAGDGSTKTKHWNMGNNTAFTMLYASSGGGWADNNYTGGTNDWVNGYYSYQIGKYVGTGDWANGVNGYRTTAGTIKGPMKYPVPDDIFLFSVPSEEYATYDYYDMSSHNFGYKLYNQITVENYAQVMTAGLLQNDLISVQGVDKQIYRIPQYKQSTVEYIALVLSQTLPIGQKDYYGNFNYNFVHGSASAQFAGADGEKRDLASALREALGLTLSPNEDGECLGNYVVPASATSGSYEDTKDRQQMLIGPFNKVIAAFQAAEVPFTFYDAAFYLLHNLFVDDSYNELQDDYNYLVLSKATVTATGKEAYVFDAGFTTGKGTANSQSSLNYSEKNGTISLTTAVGKDQIEYSGGQYTTRYPFLPVRNPSEDYRPGEYYQSNGTSYFAEDGAMSVTDYGETYATRDYNYVMQANAEFVYHYQDELFFQFQGDDDVYLFVNGELVMDIGAAHSVTSVIFYMNDYVLQAQKEMSFLKQKYGYRPDISDERFEEILDDAGITDEGEKNRDYYRRWHHLNLIDGENYSIDFYYMERHGWGANMRVATNILMTDPSMITEKKAYQDGAEINYGGIVVANEEGENDNKKNIEYSFSVTNEGTNKLYNLTFNDYAMGLTLSPETGLTFHEDATNKVNGVTIFDARGQTLEASDLLIRIDGYKDEDMEQPISKEVRFNGQYPNEQLKEFLTELYALDGSYENDNNRLFSGTGLWRHATVTIRGIYYRMTEDQVKDEQFDNIVFTTANPAVDSELVLNSADTHQVRLIGDARHIYQWAEHDVYFTREDLLKWQNEPGVQSGYIKIGSKTYSASSVRMTSCRKDGTTYDFPDIVVRDNTSITVNYLKPGTQLFFIKVFVPDSNGEPKDLNNDRILDENDYRVIPLAVYVTDMNDDAVVLDYGLEAELTGKNGITANDYIIVPNLKTYYSIMGMSLERPDYLTDITTLSKGNYNRITFQALEGNVWKTNDGTFKYTTNTDDDQIYFTPDGFMDEEYSIYIAVTVHEAPSEDAPTLPNPVGPANGGSGSGYTVDITKEVQMYQKITVLPASVMYYEDDFSSLNYVAGHETEKSGTGSKPLMQGVDQSANYGSDQVYQTKDNALYSGNSMTAIRVTEFGKLADFTFNGTGFELIGRTNAFDSASFMVNVMKDGQIIRRLPVITEFSNDTSAACDHDDQTEELTLPSDGTNQYNGSKWMTYVPGAQWKDGVVYFKNTNTKWQKVYAYAFNSDGYVGAPWPGTEMYVGQKDIYALRIPDGATKVIFTDGSSQTADLLLPTDGSNLFNGSAWSRYNPPLYFDNAATNWSQVYVYAYDPEGKQLNTAAEARMTLSGSDVYSATIPQGTAKVVFSNGKDKTDMQDLPTDGSDLFDGTSWWSYDAVQNQKYRFVFYKNTTTKWTQVTAYTAYEEKDLRTNPLVGLKLDAEGSVYSFRLPMSQTQIVFTGTNHNALGYCTACGTYVGHIYYQNKCIDDHCGQVRLDYYLVGYINGEDYGCMADSENMGQYKFVNGKLVANFKTDGYVYVKTTGNASSFMTDGYPGANVTSTYLYNTETTDGLKADKLHVPGGVELTFTLVENNDGTLTLSYTTSDDDIEDLDKTVYFDNTDGWARVNAYYWSDTDATMVAWPGKPMTLIDINDTVYTFQLPIDAEYVIFNSFDEKGVGDKTMDLTVPSENMIYSFSGFRKGWSVYNPGKTTLSFNNSSVKWQKVYIHYWNEDDDKMVEWPGDLMTLGADDIWTAAIPSNATKVVFNNGDGSKTSDLTVLKNGDIYIHSDTGSGWASEDISTSSRTVYFQNTAGWANLHIHYWDEKVEGDLVEWPGNLMIQQEGNIYKGTIPASATHVQFNSGKGGVKTLDLRLEGDTNLFVYDKVAAETVPVGSWSTYGDSSEQTPETTTRTIYLINSGNWPVPCAHYWSSNGTTTSWPGERMTYVGDNRYSITIPATTEFIIFNNNDSGVQTDDMTLVEGLNQYDYATKIWSSNDYTRTVYFVNTSNWSKPMAYFWRDDAKLSEWPGTQMTYVRGLYYSVEIPAAATKIIFSNNGDKATQTPDLTLPLDGRDLYTYSSGNWSNSGMAPEDTSTNPIYYRNTLQWDEVYVYYWSGTNQSMTQMPGVKMTAGEDGIFTANIPSSAQYVLFNNGKEGNDNKTVDLTIPTNGANLYSCPAATCGTWQSYEPQRTLYFDAGNSGWDLPHAYYWSYANQSMTVWPGQPMKHVSGTLYSVSVPAKAEGVIFNNGQSAPYTQQTADLSITSTNDRYSYNTGEWSSTTRIVYYEAAGTGSVWVTYSGNGISETEKVMIHYRDNIYSCVIPANAKYVTFTENNTVMARNVILSDDHDLYTSDGWEVFDPVAAYRKTVYFEDTHGWGDAYVHYWVDGVYETTYPGIHMTFVDDGLYMANIPLNVVTLLFNNGKDGTENQTADLTMPDGLNKFTMSESGSGGTWSTYTKAKRDAIHQVPTLRVDGLEYGTYTVEIYGMPTFMVDRNGNLLRDQLKTTYLYLDGLRIYNPLKEDSVYYADTEKDATYKELRSLILQGHAAVASYNYGTKTYTGNVSWTENRNGYGGDMTTKYVGNQLSGLEDYLLLGPNNETYLNGNAQTQAVIFYVKETEDDHHALQIAARGMDAGLFFGTAGTGISATLYQGVCIERTPGQLDYGWRPMDTIVSGTEQYYTVDYRACPYTWDQDGSKIYQVALFVRSGMVSFTTVKFVGLDLQASPVGEATNSTFENGIIYVSGTGDGSLDNPHSQTNGVANNLVSISAQMSATEWIEEEKQPNIVLKYPALSFEDEVYYNVFFTLEELDEQPVEMGLLMFDALEEDGTVFDAKAIISGVTIIDGKYVARSLGVQAKDLGKTLYFRVFARMADGRYLYSKAASYSARQYVKAVLEGDYSADTKALIASMLKYSEAARNYFGGMQTMEDLINEDVNAMVADFSSDLLPGIVKPDATKIGDFAATATGFTSKAPAVSFDGAFAIHYFFTPSTTVQGDMTLYYWSAEDYEGAEVLSAENATGSMVMTPGSRYSGAITGISAKDLDSTYYVAVVYQSNGQTYCSGVLAYSLAAYCQSKANADGSISELAKATAVYGYHAKKLFG